MLIQINSDLLASAANEGIVRIWNLTSYETKFILQGHNNVVGLKQISASMIASGSFDMTINLWNITSGVD